MARPNTLDPGLTLGADSFPTPLDWFQMLNEEGLSGVPSDMMGKQETQRLAQYFSPDYSFHLDILLLCLMSVFPGGVIGALDNSEPISSLEEMGSGLITLGSSSLGHPISQAALDGAKPHAYLSLYVNGNHPNLNV